MIRKLKSGLYRLYSGKADPKTGKRRNLGTFKTRAAAVKHEREVQYFKASYKEIARGQILGDTTGLLKLIFHLETHELLGVHIIGEDAAELIHIGQAVMAHKGTIDYFVNTVFNYPTLAECYKTAAFDGINRLG